MGSLLIFSREIKDWNFFFFSRCWIVTSGDQGIRFFVVDLGNLSLVTTLSNIRRKKRRYWVHHRIVRKTWEADSEWAGTEGTHMLARRQITAPEQSSYLVPAGHSLSHSLTALTALTPLDTGCCPPPQKWCCNVLFMFLYIKAQSSKWPTLLRSHACSLAVRNLGEQVPILFSFLSGRQKLPPANTQAMVASQPGSLFVSSNLGQPPIYYRISLDVVHCMKGWLGDGQYTSQDRICYGAVTNDYKISVAYSNRGLFLTHARYLRTQADEAASNVGYSRGEGRA